MDLRTQRAEHSAAVPPDWGFAIGFVLRSGTGVGREPRIDAADGRAVHANAILRGPEYDLVAGRAGPSGKSEAGAAVDAAHGAGGHLCQATAVDSWAWASNLSIPAARAEDRSARPGVEQRHHLHPVTAGIHLSGCGHGLVQPLRAGMGSLGFAGDVLLRVGAELGPGERSARNLQHGSGIAVYERRLYEPAEDLRHRHQHGRAWTGNRQHHDRAFMANGEIRRSVFKGLPGRAGCDRQSQKLFLVLQSRASASVPGLSDTGSRLCSTREESRMREETRHAVSRTGSRSSSINDSGAKKNCGSLRIPAKKEKSSKKERKVRKGKPVETGAAMEIQIGGLRRYSLDGFPQLLEKAYAKDAPAFSQLPQARRRLIDKPFFQGAATTP